MEKQENQYTDYIEDFLSGKLSAGEEEVFKRALESNPELAAAYRFRARIAQYWNEEEKYRATKNRVKDIIAAQKRNSGFQLRYFYIAASVILLIGVSAVLWRVVSPDNPRRDFASSVDTADQKKNTISVLEQPERASLYEAPEVYTAQDSLVITRKPDWPVSGVLTISHMEQQAVIDTYTVEEIADSLTIQLRPFEPGTYQWTIEGRDISGFFSVKEIHH
jgi:hypothetical protein